MEELCTLVMTYNLHLTVADLDPLTDIKALERVKSLILADVQGRKTCAGKAAQMRAYVGRPTESIFPKYLLH